MLHALAARIVVGVIAALGTLRLGTGLYAYKVTEALERPEYTVIQTLPGGVEIRRYEPYLIAETIVDGVGFREPTGQGFKACAGYIFGKNTKQKGWFGSSTTSEEGSNAVKMAMTAPVRVSGESPPSLQGGSNCEQDTASMRKTKVSFVIGSKYSLKTAPKPLDKNVKIRQVPAHTLAVKKFSGPPPNDKRVQKERVKLEQVLVAAGETPPGPEQETLVYGYHDPFITPNFLRRNEVALVISGSV